MIKLKTGEKSDKELELKFLFSVEYKDGTVYEQNAEDVSVSDKKRSCFFDVKQDEVKRFSLWGDGNDYTVDLTDGHFEIAGVSFFMHSSPVTNFRLIYFRRHYHDFSTDLKQRAHRVEYHFGWQGNSEDEEGKNVQRVMVLS